LETEGKTFVKDIEIAKTLYERINNAFKESDDLKESELI